MERQSNVCSLEQTIERQSNVFPYELPEEIFFQLVSPTQGRYLNKFIRNRSYRGFLPFVFRKPLEASDCNMRESNKFPLHTRIVIQFPGIRLCCNFFIDENNCFCLSSNKIRVGGGTLNRLKQFDDFKREDLMNNMSLLKYVGVEDSSRTSISYLRIHIAYTEIYNSSLRKFSVLEKENSKEFREVLKEYILSLLDKHYWKKLFRPSMLNYWFSANLRYMCPEEFPCAIADREVKDWFNVNKDKTEYYDSENKRLYDKLREILIAILK